MPSMCMYKLNFRLFIQGHSWNADITPVSQYSVSTTTFYILHIMGSQRFGIYTQRMGNHLLGLF